MIAKFTLPRARDWSAPGLDHFKKIGLLHSGMSLDDVASRCRGRFVYLAAPYTNLVVSRDGSWKTQRTVEVAILADAWACRLEHRGAICFSPVEELHQMVGDMSSPEFDPLNEELWEQWCCSALTSCHCVVVPPIRGRNESDEIWTDVCKFLKSNKSVFFIELDRHRKGRCPQ